MPKQVASSTAEVFETVSFDAGAQKIDFIDVGAGLAIMVPEWGRAAIVLQTVDVARLELLCKSMLNRR